MSTELSKQNIRFTESPTHIKPAGEISIGAHQRATPSTARELLHHILTSADAKFCVEPAPYRDSSTGQDSAAGALSPNVRKAFRTLSDDLKVCPQPIQEIISYIVLGAIATTQYCNNSKTDYGIRAAHPLGILKRCVSFCHYLTSDSLVSKAMTVTSREAYLRLHTLLEERESKNSPHHASMRKRTSGADVIFDTYERSEIASAVNFILEKIIYPLSLQTRSPRPSTPGKPKPYELSMPRVRADLKELIFPPAQNKK